MSAAPPPAASTAVAGGGAVLSAPFCSLRRAIDEHAQVTAATPRLLRVRARVLRVFPTDPRLWTARAMEPDTAPVVAAVGAMETPWVYRMVLQLCDADARDVSVGAVLADAEGAAFFGGGLPPADLCQCNATLAALQARVAALCDGRVLELALWLSRPREDETSERGVAYHIVGTQCLLA